MMLTEEIAKTHIKQTYQVSNSMAQEKILLVDDDPDILEMIRYNLEKSDFQVHTANNGEEAVKAVKSFRPDLVLLDVMMPGMDGIETCAQLRETEEGKSAIIAFLTARSEDYSQIAGLDAGGDDYISKPIRPRVLVSKVNALLRRTTRDEEREQGDGQPLVVDRDRYLLRASGKEISLPKKEFELMALLLSKPGKVFTREEILSRVWGHQVVVGDRTVDVHIRKLREKVGDDYIVTIKGVGYKVEI